MNPDLAPVQFRLAGALLRHHREAARWTLNEAAAELGCDTSKISRIETGHRRPKPDEMLKLLEAYGLTDGERQAIGTLNETASHGWWGEYRDLLPGAMVDHAMLESIADDVLVYRPQALPTFLQTPRYATAIATADPSLQTTEERRLSVALAARRAASARKQPDAAFTVVIGEAVLMQQVGGSETMLSQLRQLVGKAGIRPASVTLQVIPFSVGAHPAIGAGPLSIMRFRDVTGVGVIYEGRSANAVSVAGQAELKAAIRRFGMLRDAALPPDASLQIIREVIAAWR